MDFRTPPGANGLPRRRPNFPPHIPEFPATPHQGAPPFLQFVRSIPHFLRMFASQQQQRAPQFTSEHRRRDVPLPVETLDVPLDESELQFGSDQEAEDYRLAQRLQAEESAGVLAGIVGNGWTPIPSPNRPRRNRIPLKRTSRSNPFVNPFQSGSRSNRHLKTIQEIRESVRERERSRDPMYGCFVLSSVIPERAPEFEKFLRGCSYVEGKVDGQVVNLFSPPLPATADLLEICFVLDVTGSMIGFLDVLKSHIEGVCSILLQETEFVSVRLSVVVFGDYSDAGVFFLCKKLDFSNDSSHLAHFLRSIHGTGGGQNPEEAYELALLEAGSGLSWSNTPNSNRKFVVLIGDSVPYTPETSPIKVDWRSLLRRNGSLPLDSGKKGFARIVGIQCHHGRPVPPHVDKWWQMISAKRIILSPENAFSMFEVLIGLCLVGKADDELSQLLEKFRSLSLSEDGIRQVQREFSSEE